MGRKEEGNEERREEKRREEEGEARKEKGPCVVDS